MGPPSPQSLGILGRGRAGGDDVMGQCDNAELPGNPLGGRESREVGSCWRIMSCFLGTPGQDRNTTQRPNPRNLFIRSQKKGA